ncbi:hypothetical protein ABBQ32_004882 [Trebouxia sp. C0010 RCD-2024]
MFLQERQSRGDHVDVRLAANDALTQKFLQWLALNRQGNRAKVRHWSARGLSFSGRVHVAKQVLAASLWYHATFQRPPEQLLQQISRQLTRYVASAQHQSQGDAAVALAQGNSQDSAALPASAPSAALFPRVLTSSLPPAQGGVGLVEVPTQIQALQAKVVSRLLEPERLAWKVFQLHHLSHAPQASQLAYGATILFSTASTASLHLPARLMGYVTAFRALQPHRLLPVNAMPAEAILNEPLFLNQQIQLPLSPAATHSANGGMGSRPFTPQDQPLLLAAGITKVAHLQAALQVQHPQALTACLQSLLLALPLPWQAAATAAPTAPPWRQGHSASGTQLIQNTQTGHQHSTLEGSSTAVSSVYSCLVLTGAAVGPRTLVMGGVGLGAAACTSAGSPAGKPTLAANPGSQAWHLGSRGPDLSASSVALPWLSLDPNSGATSSGVKVDSFHASQLCWQGSSQLRRARLTASMDGIVKGAVASIGHSDSFSSKLSSSSNLHNSPSRTIQTELPLVTLWMCWPHLPATLSSLSGAGCGN